MYKCSPVYRTQLMSLRKFLFLLVFLVLSPMTALSQFDTGAVLGTVSDDKSNALSGAKVTLEETSRGTAFSAVTASDGGFSFHLSPSATIAFIRRTPGLVCRPARSFSLRSERDSALTFIFTLRK